MDDIFGGATPYTQTPQEAKEEAWHNEQYRRSLDIIRVKNPTAQDFHIEWDHRYHRVPANGTADVYRFLAIKYCRDMATAIITKTAKDLHDKKIAERAEKGLPAYQDKFTENWETYMTSGSPKTNDNQLLAEIYEDLWVGIVSEWGTDDPRQANVRAGEVDNKPFEQKILDNLAHKKVSATPQPVKEEKPFRFGEMNESLSKEQLEKEVTQ